MDRTSTSSSQEPVDASARPNEGGRDDDAVLGLAAEDRQRLIGIRDRAVAFVQGAVGFGPMLDDLERLGRFTPAGAQWQRGFDDAWQVLARRFEESDARRVPPPTRRDPEVQIVMERIVQLVDVALAGHDRALASRSEVIDLRGRPYVDPDASRSPS